MKDILMQMRCVSALDNSWPPDILSMKKTEFQEVAWSKIFLYLSDNVIRIIGETKTGFELWIKPEAQYVLRLFQTNVIC